MTICGKIVISQWEIILALIQKQWRQNRPEIVELFLNLEQSQLHIHHLKNRRGMRPLDIVRVCLAEVVPLRFGNAIGYAKSDYEDTRSAWKK
jgi:hypothetical protein